MATKGRRNALLMKRQTQVRRKMTKKTEQNGTNPDDMVGSGFVTNFTVDLKDTDLDFKINSAKSTTEEPKAEEIQSKDDETSKPEENTFVPSRTLVSAVARNDVDLLDELLQQHTNDVNTANPDVTTQSGLTRTSELHHALMLAISNKQCALVQKLLDAGADLHIADNGYPMLMMAIDIRATEVFRLLLQHAKTLKVKSSYGNLIHAAARTGDVELLKLVTERLDGQGINDASSGSGSTPLHEAVKSVKFLPKTQPKKPIEKSIFGFPAKDFQWNNTLPSVAPPPCDTLPNSVSICDKRSAKRSVGENENAVSVTLKATRSDSEHVAKPNGGVYDMACIDYLINKGCDINIQDKSGKTPLHESAIHGNACVAKRLLDAGADKTIADQKDHTPFMYALVHKCNTKLSELFLDEKTLNEPLNSEGQRHIHLACSAGNLAALKYITSTAQCDINQQYKGKTPLMIAIEKEQYSCAEYLVSCPSCNVGLITPGGNSALKLLFTFTSTEYKLTKRRSLLDAMIKQGLDINKIFIDNDATLPLIYTMQNDCPEWTEQLLECGADVNMIGLDGEYALLTACKSNSEDIAKTLIKHNADMTLTSRVSKRYEKLTPLQWALRHGNTDLVTLLLGAGCSARGTKTWLDETNEGHTAKDNLLASNTRNIIPYIESLESAPLTLQDLARHSIRKCIGVKDACERYKKLPLPVPVKKYLDLDTCLDEFSKFLLQ